MYVSLIKYSGRAKNDTGKCLNWRWIINHWMFGTILAEQNIRIKSIPFQKDESSFFW